MPINKVKSRVRFQGHKKKVRQDDGEKAQRKPTRTVFGDASDLTLVEDVVNDGPLFVKRRVPSTNELGNLLRSNLSSILAAAKAYTARKEAADPPASLTCQHIERLQEEDEDPPASFLELAPIYRPVRDHLEVTNPHAVVDEDDADNGPSASLLATTAIYAPINDHLEQVIQAHDASIAATATRAAEHPEDPPAYLLATATEAVVPIDGHVEPAQQPQADASSAAESCAVRDDDDPSASLLIGSPESLNHIRPTVRPSTVPPQPQKARPTFLQRVATLFAGRRRYPTVSEELPAIPGSTRAQHQSASTSSNSPQTVQEQYKLVATSSNPPQPILRSQKAAQHQSAASTTSSGLLRPPPPPRRATVHFGGTPRQPIPHKNLPLSPPVLAIHRPYRPIDEHLNAPFIEPAKEHKYTGTHFVAPDVFSPAEVQLGFPSRLLPTSPISPVRRQNSDAQLLDRNETVWAKWYAKNLTTEHLPFAKVGSNERLDQVGEEVTEQQAWDAHAAQHARFREVAPAPTSDIDVSKKNEDEEHGRAARLRYHPGHCFGALTGDVYPFQGGLII